MRSLRTLIDYKFIEDANEGKRVLDEVLADIGGYQSEDYDTFIFVIYETTRAFREEEWRSAIERSKPGNRVEVVVLKGTPPTQEDKDASHGLKTRKAKKAVSGVDGTATDTAPAKLGPPASDTASK